MLNIIYIKNYAIQEVMVGGRNQLTNKIKQSLIRELEWINESKPKRNKPIAIIYFLFFVSRFVKNHTNKFRENHTKKIYETANKNTEQKVTVWEKSLYR